MLKFLLRVIVIAIGGWVLFMIGVSTHVFLAVVLLGFIFGEIVTALLLEIYTPLRGPLREPIDWSNWGLDSHMNS
jgi:hypothetical protein